MSHFAPPGTSRRGDQGLNASHFVHRFPHQPSSDPSAGFRSIRPGYTRHDSGTGLSPTSTPVPGIRKFNFNPEAADFQWPGYRPQGDVPDHSKTNLSRTAVNRHVKDCDGVRGCMPHLQVSDLAKPITDCGDPTPLDHSYRGKPQESWVYQRGDPNWRESFSDLHASLVRRGLLSQQTTIGRYPPGAYMVYSYSLDYNHQEYNYDLKNDEYALYSVFDEFRAGYLEELSESDSDSDSEEGEGEETVTAAPAPESEVALCGSAALNGGLLTEEELAVVAVSHAPIGTSRENSVAGSGSSTPTQSANPRPARRDSTITPRSASREYEAPDTSHIFRLPSFLLSDGHNTIVDGLVPSFALPCVDLDKRWYTNQSLSLLEGLEWQWKFKGWPFYRSFVRSLRGGNSPGSEECTPTLTEDEGSDEEGLSDLELLLSEPESISDVEVSEKEEEEEEEEEELGDFEFANAMLKVGFPMLLPEILNT
ncbi:hypothetical protein SAICODRAFT_24681 [Saitoella complicata NRRL Y-17804]|uniref:Uncharacterized protein n=1 Tax=Saitoella complicata (strain BCRC 22490 / CBS 7301 / JCM 7358 / NBRC 10748 / NRRL Y-17804) TaxID=698492 RepID=A0A0E9NAQ6_SAICN|nr:uncharacterized protein SAICODRAFT_24681 [Saitoella complicata NRRL Y-17804]ODQ53907.1 hypothetical protein SAICODRAFT_24681 [Saitoella complicata NRRL Y-17804]GAO46878.1 hypothetical protein G7K_1096-t1 [Saitoella complicata NRRL Y-17804]